MRNEVRAQIGDKFRILAVPEGLNGADDCRSVNVIALGELAGGKEERVLRSFENRSEQLSPTRI